MKWARYQTQNTYLANYNAHITSLYLLCNHYFLRGSKMSPAQIGWGAQTISDVYFWIAIFRPGRIVGMSVFFSNNTSFQRQQTSNYAVYTFHAWFTSTLTACPDLYSIQSPYGPTPQGSFLLSPLHSGYPECTVGISAIVSGVQTHNLIYQRRTVFFIFIGHKTRHMGYVKRHVLFGESVGVSVFPRALSLQRESRIWQREYGWTLTVIRGVNTWTWWIRRDRNSRAMRFLLQHLHDELLTRIQK